MPLKIERNGKEELCKSVLLLLRVMFVGCVPVQVDISGSAV